MEKEKEVDRRRDGKILLKTGQGWTLLAQLGQLRIGQDGKGLLLSHLWCPNNLEKLWDRPDYSCTRHDTFLIPYHLSWTIWEEVA